MAQVNELKSFHKCVATLAGVLGMIQGVIWVCLALFIILCYSNAISFSNNSTNPDVFHKIYMIFIKESKDFIFSHNIITPTYFLIFMCILFAFCLSWTVFSGQLLWIGCHNKWEICSKRKLFIYWPLNTLLISIVDLVFAILIIVDLDKNLSNKIDVTISYIIILLLVSRGVIFWLLNIVTASIMLNLFRKEVKDDNAPIKTDFINGYSPTTGVAQDLWISPTNYNYFNEGYLDDDNNSFGEVEEPELFEQKPSYTNNNVPMKTFKDNAERLQPVFRSTDSTDVNIDNSYANNTDDDFIAVENPQFFESFNHAKSEATYTDNKPVISNNRQDVTAEISNNNSPMPFIPEPDYDVVNKKGMKRINSAPTIPDPDYSPPASPRSKSILRSKSSYMLF